MTEHTREQELLSHYDKKMEYYSPASFKQMTRIMEMVGHVQHGKMLDVGCGDGRAYDYAVQHDMEYVGIDYSKKRITHARKIHGIAPRFYTVDVYEWLRLQRERGRKYDFIWCCELLEHLEEPEIVWGRMKAVCRGIIVCTCPVNMPYPAHLQVYEDDAAIREAFPDITDLHHIECPTPGGKLRDHFVFTWKAGSDEEDS